VSSSDQGDDQGSGQGRPAWQRVLGELVDDATLADVVDKIDHHNAAGLMEILRGDEHKPLLVAFAQADTVAGMEAWFGSRAEGRWEHADERSGAIGEAAGVEWTYFGIHNRDLAFNGLPATGREVEVHGFTLFGAEGGSLSVRRHIDWAGLFAQLGLALNWRVPLGPEANERAAE